MVIEISTPEQLIAIADRTDRGTADEPHNIIIKNDLDFTDVADFVGIGTTLYANIDGGGHSIKNIVNNSASNLILFNLGEGCSVSNLRFENCNISTSGNFYALFGMDFVTNVIWGNTNTVVASGNLYLFYTARTGEGCIYNNVSVGGVLIAGSNMSVFYGLVTSSTSRSYGTVRNCYIVANISADGNVQMYDIRYLYNSFSRSTIKKAKTYTFATAGNNTLYMYYCYNSDKIADTITTVYAIASSGKITSSFFDNMRITNAKDTQYGTSTENLKSAEWLRSQNWAI